MPLPSSELQRDARGFDSSINSALERAAHHAPLVPSPCGHLFGLETVSFQHDITI
jgi:hypothetical protein